MWGSASSRGRRAPAVGGVILVALVLSQLGGGPVATAGETTSLRPNFVVVMTDDQPPGMMKALPSVERLIGNRGATFTNAFASYPLCCPSRATFLTGQYAHNHGTHGNTPQSGGGYPALNDKGSTLASWLDAAGYETAFAGKWLNGLRTPKVGAAGVGPMGGPGRRRRREPLLVLRLRHLPARRKAAALRDRADRLPDRRPGSRLHAAADRRAGGDAGAVLPLARRPPPARRPRPRRRRRPALLDRRARQPRLEAERDPAAALRAPLRPRRGPEAAVVRRARRQRQARGDREVGAAQPHRPRDHRGSTTAAASPRCSPSTTRCARSSASSSRRASSRTRCSSSRATTARSAASTGSRRARTAPTTRRCGCRS